MSYIGTCTASHIFPHRRHKMSPHLYVHSRTTANRYHIPYASDMGDRCSKPVSRNIQIELKKIMLTLCFPAGVFLVAAPTSAKNQPRLFSSPLRNRILQHALPASDTNRTLHLSGVAPSCSSCLEGRYVFLRLYHPNSQRSTCPCASDW